MRTISKRTGRGVATAGAAELAMREVEGHLVAVLGRQEYQNFRASLGRVLEASTAPLSDE